MSYQYGGGHLCCSPSCCCAFCPSPPLTICPSQRRHRRCCPRDRSSRGDGSVPWCCARPSSRGGSRASSALILSLRYSPMTGVFLSIFQIRVSFRIPSTDTPSMLTGSALCSMRWGPRKSSALQGIFQVPLCRGTAIERVVSSARSEGAHGAARSLCRRR